MKANRLQDLPSPATVILKAVSEFENRIGADPGADFGFRFFCWIRGERRSTTMENATKKKGGGPSILSANPFRVALFAAIPLTVILTILSSGYFVSETFRVLFIVKDEEAVETVLAQNALINCSALYCLIAILFLIAGYVTTRGLYWIGTKIGSVTISLKD